MRPGNSYILPTTLCALALLFGSASNACAQNKSPPPSDHTASASSGQTERTGKEDRERTMLFEPGDTIFCTISNGKEETRTVQTVILPGHTADELCPLGTGRITNFVIHAGSVRYLPAVLGAAPPVGGGDP